MAVTVNGIAAVCSDARTANSSCGFRFRSDLTPLITNISATTAHPDEVLVGDVFTISGTGFGTTNASLAVTMERLGASGSGNGKDSTGICTVLSLSDTEIVCRAGHAPQGAFAVSVLRTDVGRATVGEGVGNNFTYGLRVVGMWPPSGAPAGGNALRLWGTGFDPAAGMVTVTVDGQPCRVRAARFSEVVCEVPALANVSQVWASNGTNSNVNASVVVTVGGGQSATSFALDSIGLYEYDWTQQPVVVDVQPRMFSAAVTTLINLTGDFSLHTSFNNNNNSSSSTGAGSENYFDDDDNTVGGGAANATARGVCRAKVLFGTHACSNVVVASATLITCTLTRGAPQPIDAQIIRPRVVLCGSDGRSLVAHSEPGVEADVAFRVLQLSGAVGSIAGGTELRISGAGFVANRRNRLSVAVVARVNETEEVSAEVVCTVQHSSFNEILCNTSSLGHALNVSVWGRCACASTTLRRRAAQGCATLASVAPARR